MAYELTVKELKERVNKSVSELKSQYLELTKLNGNSRHFWVKALKLTNQALETTESPSSQDDDDFDFWRDIEGGGGYLPEGEEPVVIFDEDEPSGWGYASLKSPYAFDDEDDYEEEEEEIDQDEDDFFWDDDEDEDIEAGVELSQKRTQFKNLTPSQQKAFNEIIDFCLDSFQKMYKLVGYAGTGKSFLIVQVIKELIALGQRVVIASPTNKAANNVRTMAVHNGIGVEVVTIARLLGLFPEIEIENGEQVFIVTDENKRLSSDLIIIDEYSMLSKDILTILLKMVDYKTKILFVGDNAQLPPINETTLPVDTFKMSFSKLTEVVRYSGSLAKVAEEIRSCSIYNSKVYPFGVVTDHTIECLPRGKWGYKAAEMIGSDEFKKNPLYARIIVWRNKTADIINTKIRQLIFGAECKPFEIGDLLIAKTPVFRKEKIINKKGGEKEEWVIVMNNSEEAVVIGDCTEEEITIKLFGQKFNFEYFVVPVMTDGYIKLELKILKDSFKESLDIAKKQCKEYIFNSKSNRQSLWESYQILEKTFDNTPFGYAITTHKSQGSSIENVFVDIVDMRGCPELQKLQYTAITRAKSKLWIPL